MELYIFNLHPQLVADDLRIVLEEFGAVLSLQLARDLTKPQEPTQVAHVYMQKAADAESIAQHLDGDIINGRPLKIQLVSPRRSTNPTLSYGTESS
jgi:RNA recognition motif-containing protein